MTDEIDKIKKQLTAKKKIIKPNWTKGLSSGSTLLNLADVRSLDFRGFPNYAISLIGEVFSLQRGTWQEKIGILHDTGYLAVSLWKNNKERILYVHRLVLEAFVGECPEGMQCRHLNGNRTDNRLENLCWGTPAEDANDRKRHGTNSRGLTVEQVKEIRKLGAEKSLPNYKIGKIFGVSGVTIAVVLARKSWGHIP